MTIRISAWSLRCNLNNAGGEPIKFHGTKGTMEIIWIKL